jgi:hypothetical protein
MDPVLSQLIHLMSSHFSKIHFNISPSTSPLQSFVILCGSVTQHIYIYIYIYMCFVLMTTRRIDHFKFWILIIQDEEYKGEIRVHRDNAGSVSLNSMQKTALLTYSLLADCLLVFSLNFLKVNFQTLSRKVGDFLRGLCIIVIYIPKFLLLR